MPVEVVLRQVHLFFRRGKDVAKDHRVQLAVGEVVGELQNDPLLVQAVYGLPQQFVDRLIVERTGTVSERLWRLITVEDPGDPTSPPKAEIVDARWLTTLPDAIWQIVRDAVLRCA